MTITLHWWLIPCGLILLGAWFILTSKPTSDYDFMTPVIGVMIGIALIVGAGLFMLGRWFA